MEFNVTKRPRIQIDNALSHKYPHDLQMYRNPPDSQITLREFEELAIERLKGELIQSTDTVVFSMIPKRRSFSNYILLTAVPFNKLSLWCFNGGYTPVRYWNVDSFLIFSVLRVLELVSLKGTKNYDDWKNNVIAELNHQGLTLYRKLVKIMLFLFHTPCHSSLDLRVSSIFICRLRVAVSIRLTRNSVKNSTKLAKEITRRILFYVSLIAKVKNIVVG
jgi:hypothetical protein